MNPHIVKRFLAKKVILFVLFTLGVSFPALGYKEVPVESGGAIRGKVFLRGSVPPARIFHLILSPNMEFCGKVSDGKGNRLVQEFRVSSDGGFADVVVALVGVEQGKPFDFIPALTFENCQIGPFVLPIRNHHPVAFINKDPIPHDVQGYSIKDPYTFGMFNRRINPETTAFQKVRLRKSHYLFRTQCGIHAYMQSWGMAVGNPYFAVSSENGTFEISEVPPGTYHLLAWHPLMDIRVQEVLVRSGKASPIFFEFDANEVEIPLHDLQEGYRFDTVLQPEQVVKPLVLQRP